MSTKGKEKSKKNANTIPDKLRVLCLHGYRQNDKSFKSKIGMFRSVDLGVFQSTNGRT